MNRFKISTLVFLFSLLMSSRVFSQTNYDFSATIDTGGSVTTSFTSTGPALDVGGVYMNMFSGMTNLIVNSSVISNAAFTPVTHRLLPPDFQIQDPTAYYGGYMSASPYQDVNRFSYQSNNGYYNFLVINGVNGSGIGTISTYATSSDMHNGVNLLSTTNLSNGTWMQVSSAPEIDGSLAPKVGFLLGCLFLMFGRKRSNLEGQLGKLMS